MYVSQALSPHVISQVATPGLHALSLAVVVAAIYLAVIRLMDLNEKEPLLAVALMFALGGVFAGLLSLVASPTLELSQLWGPVAQQASVFAAFALGAAALTAASRSRGWPEISGLMDGVVYGSAVEVPGDAVDFHLGSGY